ncbi:MAG: DNA-directed RNA polymerase subunit alpha [Victivallaceae bacterium]|nr:DNA-directed RNA polymerase subunit alpha [Victivallaceae bacterium]
MTVASEFPMPHSILVDEETTTTRYAKFTAAPYQIGFGHTLGNSLRRVLLSSLEGAAICAVRIEGAPHEFVSLPNIVEDVTEIVLNLKNVRIALFGDTSKTLEIKKNKAGKVTAADISTDGSAEVLNPEQVICTLDKDVPFRAEIDVINGKGYLPAEKQSVSRAAGSIPIDCLFSPVVRVNYKVGAARVGEETEMDSLELEIWTDGRISPNDALEKAAEILSSHLQPFLGSAPCEKDAVSLLTEEEAKLFKTLSMTVEHLDLSVRAVNCLKNASIKIIGELVTKSESKMLKYRNFGKKSLDEIKEKISVFDLTLGMTFSDNVIAALDKETEQLKNEGNGGN